MLNPCTILDLIIQYMVKERVNIITSVVRNPILTKLNHLNVVFEAEVKIFIFDTD